MNTITVSTEKNPVSSYKWHNLSTMTPLGKSSCFLLIKHDPSRESPVPPGITRAHACADSSITGPLEASLVLWTALLCIEQSALSAVAAFWQAAQPQRSSGCRWTCNLMGTERDGGRPAGANNAGVPEELREKKGAYILTSRVFFNWPEMLANTLPCILQSPEALKFTRDLAVGFLRSTLFKYRLIWRKWDRRDLMQAQDMHT